MHIIETKLKPKLPASFVISQSSVFSVFFSFPCIFLPTFGELKILKTARNSFKLGRFSFVSIMCEPFKLAHFLRLVISGVFKREGGIGRSTPLPAPPLTRKFYSLVLFKLVDIWSVDSR